MSLELNSWPVISLQWYASIPNSLNEISRRIICQEMWLWRLKVWISHLRWVRNEPKLDIRSLTTLLTFSLAPILFPPKPPCSTSCLMNMVVVGFHNKSFRSFILQASCSIMTCGIEQGMYAIASAITYQTSLRRQSSNKLGTWQIEFERETRWWSDGNERSGKNMSALSYPPDLGQFPHDLCGCQITVSLYLDWLIFTNEQLDLSLTSVPSCPNHQPRSRVRLAMESPGVTILLI